MSGEGLFSVGTLVLTACGILAGLLREKPEETPHAGRRRWRRFLFGLAFVGLIFGVAHAVYSDRKTRKNEADRAKETAAFVQKIDGLNTQVTGLHDDNVKLNKQVSDLATKLIDAYTALAKVVTKPLKSPSDVDLSGLSNIELRDFAYGVTVQMHEQYINTYYIYMIRLTNGIESFTDKQKEQAATQKKQMEADFTQREARWRDRRFVTCSHALLFLQGSGTEHSRADPES